MDFTILGFTSLYRNTYRRQVIVMQMRSTETTVESMNHANQYFPQTSSVKFDQEEQPLQQL